MLSAAFLPYSAAILLFILLFNILHRRSVKHFPPGPRGLPIIGNVFGVPKSYEWLEYQRWSKLYGIYRALRLSLTGN